MESNNQYIHLFEDTLIQNDDFETTYSKGYREGYEEGYREGYEEGYREGYEEGYRKGYEEGRKEVALKMIAQGLQDEMISTLTGLSLSDIFSLRTK